QVGINPKRISLGQEHYSKIVSCKVTDREVKIINGHSVPVGIYRDIHKCCKDKIRSVRKPERISIPGSLKNSPTRCFLSSGSVDSNIGACLDKLSEADGMAGEPNPNPKCWDHSLSYADAIVSGLGHLIVEERCHKLCDC